ncbi:MAG: hypothetical protein K0R47_5164 [Brevibacillus sp.]|jgi:transcriptional regulator with XRE-family HTH domain|nr:hypothetical protein [Brevibacillus sp.]
MNVEEKKEMGRRIRAAREEKGLTQDELANKLGVKNRASVANYEAGRTVPPGDVIRELANILNIDSDYILARDYASKSHIDISDAIKEERLKHGYSQQQLAQIVGVSQKQISNYEAGLVMVPFDVIDKLMDAFDISYQAFLNRYNMWDGYVHPEFDGDVDKQIAFEKARDEDAMSESPPQTIAAHFDGDDLTPEELEEIREYAKYLKSKRKE